MAYEPTNWENREVERPRTYIMTENGDGTVTLTPSEGTVFAAGTPLDAANLNKIEEQVALNDENKVNRDGDTMTGPLNGTVINATSNLQENGVNLSSKYQPKGSYAPSDDYVKWLSDLNGVRIDCGRFGGNGKPVILFLTSAQPSPTSQEHRVWIQIDKF